MHGVVDEDVDCCVYTVWTDRYARLLKGLLGGSGFPVYGRNLFNGKATLHALILSDVLYIVMDDEILLIPFLHVAICFE